MTYLFLTNTISGIGGGQLYLAAKSRLLLASGRRVAVWHSGPQLSSSLLPEGADALHVTELNFRFEAAPAGMRRKVAQQLKRLTEGDAGKRIIIESFNSSSALWGEWLASLCGGVHIFYHLTEGEGPLSPSMREFYRFKLRQHALYGISPGSIPSILPEADGAATYLPALGASQLLSEEDVAQLSAVGDGTFTVLTVARLEKPYLPAIMRAVRELARTNPSREFCHLIVGDFTGSSPIAPRLSAAGGCPNLHILQLPARCPLERAILERADCFAGNAGAARLAYSFGMPTVVVDSRDCKAIGILGSTTFNYIHRLEEPAADITALLQQIMDGLRRYGSEKERTLPGFPATAETEARHLRLCEEAMAMTAGLSYFPVTGIRRKSTLTDFVYRQLSRLAPRLMLRLFKRRKMKSNTTLQKNLIAKAATRPQAAPIY